jgi:general secretion pathway protein D
MAAPIPRIVLRTFIGLMMATAILMARADDAPTDPPRKPITVLGSDRLVAKPLVVPGPSGPPIAFRFEDAPIADVAQLLFRDVLAVDYVLHPPLSGTVTLATRGQISPDLAVYLFEAALQANGMQMVRDSRGVYHLGRPDSLRGVVPAVRQMSGNALAPGVGAIVVPLEFIGATEMATILRPAVPADALLRVDTLRNLLVLSGSRTQAEGWLDLIRTFDIDVLKGMSVGVYPLKHASTKDVEAALKLLASGMNSQPAAASGTPAAPSTVASSRGTESISLLGGIRILPIEKMNSVLVVAPRAAYLNQARDWIERLDRPSDSATEPQLHLYPVQNGSASHLASVLSGLFGSGGNPATSNSGVAPGLSAATTASRGFGGGFSSPTVGQTQGVSSVGTATGQGAAGQPSQQAAAAVNLVQGVRIMADEINNAVLVYGPRTEFGKIEAILKRLDVSPTQVLIEASIVEVTLGDDLQYGLQWAFNDSARGGLTGNGILSSIAGGVLGGSTAGFSYTLSNASGNVRAVLNALAEKSLVKVISSPSLMVLDNHTASIVVGNQQPIRSSETVTNIGVNTSIQYKDTGVSLAVTPSVNAGSMVTMTLQQGVTDVGQVDAATGQRSFLQRQINSKVAVRSGETLVLGGLIRDNTTTGKSGVPLLQEIPIIGGLFGTDTSKASRTELLVVITPKVVRSDQDARDVGAELRERAKLLFGEAAIGGQSFVPASAP